jgi:F0F1-type ATP synthase delta subunit
LRFNQINALDKVESELFAFVDVLGKSPGLAAYLANPTVAADEKQKQVRREPIFI